MTTFLECDVLIERIEKMNDHMNVREWVSLPQPIESLNNCNVVKVESSCFNDKEKDILKLNDYVTRLHKLAESEHEIIIDTIMGYISRNNSIEMALRILENKEYESYESCRSVVEFAENVIGDNGLLDNVNDENILKYFNFEKYGQDIIDTGKVIRVNHHIYVRFLTLTVDDHKNFYDGKKDETQASERPEYYIEGSMI